MHFWQAVSDICGATAPTRPSEVFFQERPAQTQKDTLRCSGLAFKQLDFFLFCIRIDDEQIKDQLIQICISLALEADKDLEKLLGQINEATGNVNEDADISEYSDSEDKQEDLYKRNDALFTDIVQKAYPDQFDKKSWLAL